LTPEFGTVTAVIPTWNRADLLTRILEDLRQQTYPIQQIVVVDNGSTDDSAAIAEAAGALTIRLPSNLGFAAAVNRGWALSSTEWIAVLNNDVKLPPNWLSTVVEQARQQGASFATGKLLDSKNRDRIDGTFDLVSLAGATWRCGNGRRDGPEWSFPQRIQFAPFTAVLLCRSALSDVGYLDERFGSYLEDVDWGFRCAAQGLTGVYVPAAVAFHTGSATLGAWRKATVRLISRNQMLIYCKHLRGGKRWPAAVGQLLWLLLAFRRGTGLAAIQGKIDAYRNYAAWSSQENDHEAVRIAVEESERTILRIQRQTGFDTYWRLYFRLIGK
jgi:GT2 family glycosyltransferase